MPLKPEAQAKELFWYTCTIPSLALQASKTERSQAELGNERKKAASKDLEAPIDWLATRPLAAREQEQVQLTSLSRGALLIPS